MCHNSFAFVNVKADTIELQVSAYFFPLLAYGLLQLPVNTCILGVQGYIEQRTKIKYMQSLVGIYCSFTSNLLASCLICNDFFSLTFTA